MKKLIAIALFAIAGSAFAQDAKISITRDSAVSGGPYDLRVVVDGKEVCKIANGSRCHFDTAPGKKNVELFIPGIFGKVAPTVVSWDLKEGKHYEFVTAPASSGFSSVFGLAGAVIDAARDADTNFDTVIVEGLFRIRTVAVR